MRIAAAGMQEVVDELLRPRTVVEPEPEPSDFTVLTASLYPNPVVESATLRLAVPQPIDARIEVFDALGREAAHIESGVLPEGNHMYELSVSDWPPGVYLIRIQLNHLIDTRTLVVGR